MHDTCRHQNGKCADRQLLTAARRILTGCSLLANFWLAGLLFGREKPAVGTSQVFP